MIFEILQYVFTALLIVLLGINFAQRRHMDTGKRKRFAVLYILMLGAVPAIAVIGAANGSLEPYFFYLSLGAVALCFLVYRKKLFLFRFKCRDCGRPLSLPQILFDDENRCTGCAAAAYDTVDEIDWPNLKFTEKAVLCFIRSEGKLLLIHKKTGLGRGKINAPGGRIEPGETAAEAAVRECREETGMTPENVTAAGELNFYFRGGYSLKGYVFTATGFDGILTETEEADPFWCAEDEIPYDKMWEDDRYWLPKLLAGEPFEGYFLLEKDRLLDYRVE